MDIKLLKKWKIVKIKNKSLYKMYEKNIWLYIDKTWKCAHIITCTFAEKGYNTNSHKHINISF